MEKEKESASTSTSRGKVDQLGGESSTNLVRFVALEIGNRSSSPSSSSQLLSTSFGNASGYLRARNQRDPDCESISSSCDDQSITLDVGPEPHPFHDPGNTLGVERRVGKRSASSLVAADRPFSHGVSLELGKRKRKKNVGDHAESLWPDMRSVVPGLATGCSFPSPHTAP